MDIYTDYANWKFENHEFISSLVKNKSKTISRFTPVIVVVDYLYDQVVNHQDLTEDEETIFSTGFDYIFDQFHFIKTLYDYRFNKDINELEKYAVTINLLLYVHDFQSEGLQYDSVDISPLDILEQKINYCLDHKENAPEEYFEVLNKITKEIFDNKGITVHTIDQIFYEIALEYGIYEDDEFNIYNSFIEKQINKNDN